MFREKSTAVRILWHKFGGEGKYTPPSTAPSPRNRVKVTQLHKRFILAYFRTTILLKKNSFEKFIEELDFVELSTQAKHLRA